MTTSPSTDDRRPLPVPARTGAMDAALMCAAWQVLERSGYRSLKIRQVLDASHSSASAFYRRFPSKAHLVSALHGVEAARAVRTIEELVDDTDDPREQLTRWLRFHVVVRYDRRALARARMFADPDFVAAQPDAVAAHRAAVGAPLVDIVRRGVRAGVFTSTAPEIDADAIFALVRGLVYDPLSPEPTEPLESTLARVQRYALNMLAGVPADHTVPLISGGPPTPPTNLRSPAADRPRPA